MAEAGGTWGLVNGNSGWEHSDQFKYSEGLDCANVQLGKSLLDLPACLSVCLTYMSSDFILLTSGQHVWTCVPDYQPC